MIARSSCSSPQVDLSVAREFRLYMDFYILTGPSRAKLSGDLSEAFWQNHTSAIICIHFCSGTICNTKAYRIYGNASIPGNKLSSTPKTTHPIMNDAFIDVYVYDLALDKRAELIDSLSGETLFSDCSVNLIHK